MDINTPQTNIPQEPGIRQDSGGEAKKSWFASHMILGIVFLLAVAAAAVAGIYYWQTVRQVPITIDLPVHKEKVDPLADWKTYTNSQYGFSFKYPANLYLLETKRSTGSQYAIKIYLSKKVLTSESTVSESDIFMELATPDSLAAYRNPCEPNTACLNGEIVKLACESLYKTQTEGTYTGTEEDLSVFTYSVVNIAGIKGCSDFEWRFTGESSTEKIIVFTTPQNNRFEFGVYIGLGLEKGKSVMLTDTSLPDWENKFEYPEPGFNSDLPRKGSSERVGSLNQILTTFKFTNPTSVPGPETCPLTEVNGQVQHVCP